MTYLSFKVSISALEDSLFLTWPVQQLQLYLKSKPFLAAVFTNLVGKDITHKLYQVSTKANLVHFLSSVIMLITIYFNKSFCQRQWAGTPIFIFLFVFYLAGRPYYSEFQSYDNNTFHEQ